MVALDADSHTPYWAGLTWNSNNPSRSEFLSLVPMETTEQLLKKLSKYQLYRLDKDCELEGYCHAVPFTWTGKMEDLAGSWADILRKCLLSSKEENFNTLCGLGFTIEKDRKRKEYDKEALLALKRLASDHDMTNLIIPVRPTLKNLYPLTRIDRYIAWVRCDGSPFDSSLRFHWQEGGRVLQEASGSYVVTGSVEEWMEWTGMEFPESGDYLPQGALSPVSIDLQRDIGIYNEPSVWVLHGLDCSNRPGDSKNELNEDFPNVLIA